MFPAGDFILLHKSFIQVLGGSVIRTKELPFFLPEGAKSNHCLSQALPLPGHYQFLNSEINTGVSHAPSHRQRGRLVCPCCQGVSQRETSLPLKQRGCAARPAPGARPKPLPV